MSHNQRLTASALRVLGRCRQPAWILPADNAIQPARSRWRAGVVRHAASDLGTAIVEAARTVGATHVLPDDVAMFVAVAEVSQDLAPAVPFPSCSPAEILRFDSKSAFAALATSLGLPAVPTYVAESGADAAAQPFDFPIIIKPANDSGGAGQRRCMRQADLEAYLRSWPAGEQVIQPLIAGSDVHLSFVADHGELIGWEIREPFPRHRPTPGAFRSLEDDAALGIARRFVADTAYHGMGNLDLRRDDMTGRLSLLECNPRLYATMDVAARAGANLLTLGMDLADGRRPDHPVVARRRLLHTGRKLPSSVVSRPPPRVYWAAMQAAALGLTDVPLTIDMFAIRRDRQRRSMAD